MSDPHGDKVFDGFGMALVVIAGLLLVGLLISQGAIYIANSQ